MRSALRAAVLAAAITLPISTMATVASATTTPPPDDLSLVSAPVSVTSTTGRALHAIVSVDQSASNDVPDKALLTVVVYKGTQSGPDEVHIWSYQIPADDVAFDESTGALTLDATGDIGTFGTIHLTFAKTSGTTQNCGSGNSTASDKGTLSGTFLFKTATHWGNVGSATATTTFPTPNHLAVTHGLQCSTSGGGGVQPCITSVFWAAFFDQNFNRVAIGITFGARSLVSYQASHSLPNLPNADRTDLLTVRAPHPIITTTKRTVNGKTVTTHRLQVRGNGRRLTGTAKIASTNASTSTTRCVHRGVRHHEHVRAHFGSWRSPRTLSRRLSFHFDAVSIQRARHLADAEFSTATWT